MTQTVKAIPEGYHAVTPYLCVEGAAGAIAFYKKAFGATEVMRMPGPQGSIGHAELQIGDSRIMLADEYPDMNFRGPRSVGGTPVHIHVYVDQVDRVVTDAVTAGAKLLRPVATQFYGDRLGTVEDPYGHVWHISTHVEDLSEDELKRRAETATKARPKNADEEA